GRGAPPLPGPAAVRPARTGGPIPSRHAGGQGHPSPRPGRLPPRSDPAPDPRARRRQRAAEGAVRVPSSLHHSSGPRGVRGWKEVRPPAQPPSGGAVGSRPPRSPAGRGVAVAEVIPIDQATGRRTKGRRASQPAPPERIGPFDREQI